METKKYKATIRLQLRTRGGHIDSKPDEYSPENVEVRENESILLVKPGSRVFGGWLYCANIKEISETKVSLEINQLNPKPTVVLPSYQGCIVLDSIELGLHDAKKWNAPVIGSSIVWTLELLAIS